MQSIIVPSGNDAHANPDQAARQRADRLARATPEQIEEALAYLSMIDPEAFEIATSASDADREQALTRLNEYGWQPRTGTAYEVERLALRHAGPRGSEGP